MYVLEKKAAVRNFFWWNEKWFDYIIKNTISKNLNGTQVIVIAQGHLAIMPCYAHYVKSFKKVQPPEHCFHSVSAKFLFWKINEYQKKIRKIKTFQHSLKNWKNFLYKIWKRWFINCTFENQNDSVCYENLLSLIAEKCIA